MSDDNPSPPPVSPQRPNSGGAQTPSNPPVAPAPTAGTTPEAHRSRKWPLFPDDVIFLFCGVALVLAFVPLPKPRPPESPPVGTVLPATPLKPLAIRAPADPNLGPVISLVPEKPNRHDHKLESAAATAKLGTTAPEFTLKDTDGKEVSLSQFKGKIVVLEWYNSACPFVVLHHKKYTTMTDTAKKFGDKVQWVAINSSAPGKAGHGLDITSKKEWSIAYPILNDETGKVGRLYGAKTTPHMFVIDAQGVLQYAGAIDNDAKNEKSPGEKLNYVAQAIDELLANKPVSQKEIKAYGSSVKYGS